MATNFLIFFERPTGQMIYAEDKLLDGSILTKGSQEFRDANSLAGHGLVDGSVFALPRRRLGQEPSSVGASAPEEGADPNQGMAPKPISTAAAGTSGPEERSRSRAAAMRISRESALHRRNEKRPIRSTRRVREARPERALGFLGV